MQALLPRERLLKEPHSPCLHEDRLPVCRQRLPRTLPTELKPHLGRCVHIGTQLQEFRNYFHMAFLGGKMKSIQTILEENRKTQWFKSSITTLEEG